MADNFDEDWRPIPGFEGLYSVSSLGRIHSEPRLTVRRGSPMTLRGGILKTPLSPTGGYARFNARLAGKSHHLFVHQVVMLAFVGPPPAGQEVRHLDGNPANSRLSNLEYGTRAQNIDDARRHGTFPLLEDRPGAKLTREKAAAIAASDKPADALAVEFGVGRQAIQDIRSGKSWASVTEGVRKADYRPRGARHHNTRITDQDVREIVTSPMSVRGASRHFGTSRETIRAIRSGRVWDGVIGGERPSLDPALARPNAVVGGAEE